MSEESLARALIEGPENSCLPFFSASVQVSGMGGKAVRFDRVLPPHRPQKLPNMVPRVMTDMSATIGTTIVTAAIFR